MEGLEPLDALFVIVMTIVSLAFQVFIVVLGVAIAWRWLHRPGGFATMQQARQKTAFEILDERYARGEIDAREDEERREQLLHRGSRRS